MPSRRSFIVGSTAIATATAGCSDLVEEFDPDGSSSDDRGSDDGPMLDDQETRRDLVETYNDAIGHTNVGLETRDNGIAAQNDEDFDRAGYEFETAAEAFGSAAEDFADALALSFQIEHEGAEEACKTGNEFARTMESAMSIIASSTEAAAMGEIEVANEILEDGRELDQEANDMDVRNTDEVAEMLGVEPEGGF